MKRIDPRSSSTLAEFEPDLTSRSDPSPDIDADSSLDDPRVLAALEEYMDALESGERPNRDAFLAKHPQIADVLEECLGGMDALRSANSEAIATELDLSDDGGSEWGPGAILGDFRIEREIGRGGMGVVYEAEQISLRRRIALKVLPFAMTLDSRQLQRFKNEARAAAQLHHPGIVPIYAVGSERGVHFHAMQFIEGQTLASAIQMLKQARSRKGTASGSESSPPDWIRTHKVDKPRFHQIVARLGIQAAEALEHAHGCGVVHRDVKPGNILVDAGGHLWIADFGLAQAQWSNDSALTNEGELLGTLRYMSPEQALAKRGLVDHRTDVYSLGVTLYELLTLAPVYDGRDREELLRQIAFDEPREPGRLDPDISADLETIILKAMAKAVEDRYATAKDLAEDLQRFLEHKPILARRPNLWERAAKWSRRHRGAAVGALLFLLLSAVGFASSTVIIIKEHWKTQKAYQAAAKQWKRAEENSRKARQVVDFFAKVSEEELAEWPEAQSVRRKMLEAALDYYQDFINENDFGPVIRKELVASQLHVASILDQIGTPSDARNAMERTRAMVERLGREDPEAGEMLHSLLMIKQMSTTRAIDEIQMLSQESVQQDLGLSADKIEEIEALWSQAAELFRGMRDSQKNGDEGRRMFDDISRRGKALVDSLTKEQERRLQQIMMQQRGPFALADPEVIAALHLTREQVERLETMQLEDHRLMPIRRPPPWIASRKDMDRPQQNGRRLSDRLLGVLDPTQKSLWIELQGKPFQGELRLGPRGGRPPDFPEDRR